MIIKAITNNEVRKEEFRVDSETGLEIIKRLPAYKLQGNRDKVSMVADDGDVISVYFGVKCWGVEPPVFSDIEYLYDNVEMVCLKYIKETDEHFYKYYVRANPLNIKKDNIVGTGFFTNDPEKATVYIVSEVYKVEEDNDKFFLEDYKGITIDIATEENLMETYYEGITSPEDYEGATSPEGSQG